MGNPNLYRVAADIPIKTRDFLLRRFPPQFPEVHCTTITHAYQVPAHYRRPAGLQTVNAYALHVADDHEALLVRVNGQVLRPDGMRYFIAMSVAKGEAPYRACEIDTDGIKMLDAEIAIHGLAFKLYPVWQRARSQAA